MLQMRMIEVSDDILCSSIIETQSHYLDVHISHLQVASGVATGFNSGFFDIPLLGSFFCTYYYLARPKKLYLLLFSIAYLCDLSHLS